MPDSTRDLRRLPKAHLHLHFEQSIRQSTLDEFADELSRPSPQMTGFSTFTEFDDLCQAAINVMRTPEHLIRMVDDMVDDAASQGCVWIEPAVWLPLHRKFIGPDEHTLEILVDAARSATERTGVGVGWILAINRNEGLDQAIEQAAIASRWDGRGVVGLGLHNDESHFPAEEFARAFAVIDGTGLLRVPHAGELAGPQSVRRSIEELGAHRIQHGFRAIEDLAVVDLLLERELCLDICPTSNVVIGVVPSFGDHPLPELIAAGVAVSINADDPVCFGCDIVSEYALCRSEFVLYDRTLADVARASLTASGAPTEIVERGIAGIDAWLTGGQMTGGQRR